MARPISLKRAEPVPDVEVKSDGLVVKPKPFFSPPKGLDYLRPPNRVDPEYCTEMQNLYLDRGTLRSRHGTSAMGGANANAVMAVVNFVTSTGVGFILRFTLTKLQQWNGAGWDEIAGATFTGNESNYFTYTAFNDTLIFSNGVDGLWEFAPLVGSLMLIEEGPNALHLTTFNERVIASVADGDNKMQWSASRNSRDWDGIGSGFEDLLSTPGGVVDSLMGVFPISDDVALMVRSGSIWQVTTSGDPEAPFRFGRLYANLGSRSRHAIDVIPGGIVMLGTDDVWIITDSEIKTIGDLVKDRFFLEAADLRQARGIYRARTKEFWLTFGDTDVVYRYSFLDQGWTKHKYTFDIRWFDESVYHYEGMTWDEVVGTWDAQTDVWDNLLGDAREDELMFATSEVLGRVLKDDDAVEDDAYIQSGKLAQGISIDTGVISASSPLDKTEVIEIQVEYEQGSVTQTVALEFSTDGGNIWNTYSSKTLLSTAGKYAQLARAMKTIERKQMAFRMRSSTLGRLRLMTFIPFLVVGAKVNP